MEPQQLDTPHNEKIFIGIIVGLLLGGGGGYYAGWMLGQAKGIEAATVSIQQQIPNSQVAAQTNPLEDIKTNPYEDVKVNPFE